MKTCSCTPSMKMRDRFCKVHGVKQNSTIEILNESDSRFVKLNAILDGLISSKGNLSSEEVEKLMHKLEELAEKLTYAIPDPEDSIDSSTDELPNHIQCESFEDVVLFVKNKIDENLGKDIALLPADDIEQRTIGLALLIGDDEEYVLQASVGKPTSLLLDVYLCDTEGFCESLLKKNKSIIKYNKENLQKQNALSYIKSSVVEMDAVYDHLKNKFSEERIKNCNLTFLSSMTSVISEVIEKLSSYKLDEVDMSYSVAPISGDRKSNEVKGAYRSTYDMSDNGELVVVRKQFDVDNKIKGAVSRHSFSKR